MTLADAKVFKLRSDSNGDIAGERPGGRGPHEQALPLAINQREAKRDTGMRELLVTLGDDLVLAQPRPAARAPWHHVMPFVDPASLMARFQGSPDGVVVLIREGEVGSAQLGESQSGPQPERPLPPHPRRPPACRR